MRPKLKVGNLSGRTSRNRSAENCQSPISAPTRSGSASAMELLNYFGTCNFIFFYFYKSFTRTNTAKSYTRPVIHWAKMPKTISFLIEVFFAIMTIILIALTSVAAEVDWANKSHLKMWAEFQPDFIGCE